MHRIAVLDDDGSWCFAIKRFLRSYCEVFTFTDTDSFLISPLDLYSLVLIDFSISPIDTLEVMNGYQVIQHLKQQLPKPPLFVLVSGFFGVADAAFYAEKFPDADAILTKDMGLDAILERIQAILPAARNVGASYGTYSPT